MSGLFSFERIGFLRFSLSKFRCNFMISFFVLDSNKIIFLIMNLTLLNNLKSLVEMVKMNRSVAFLTGFHRI